MSLIPEERIVWLIKCDGCGKYVGPDEDGDGPRSKAQLHLSREQAIEHLQSIRDVGDEVWETITKIGDRQLFQDEHYCFECYVCCYRCDLSIPTAETKLRAEIFEIDDDGDYHCRDLQACEKRRDEQ